MLDTKTPNALVALGTQSVGINIPQAHLSGLYNLDPKSLIGEARRGMTLRAAAFDVGWPALPPTAVRPETFVEEVGPGRYVTVTISKRGEMRFVLAGQPALSPISGAETAHIVRGGEMLFNAATVDVRPGMRVELTGKPTAVTLRGRTGTVVREDEDEDYVVVELDTPALYRHLNGKVEELPEIVVMVDNLRALSN